MTGRYNAIQFARFLYRWHGLDRPKTGGDARLKVVEQLQGYGIPYTDLETSILPARITDYQYGELDRLCEPGTVVWQGYERLSSSDGVIALYKKDELEQLGRISGLVPGQRYIPLRSLLAEQACDFEQIKSKLGGFPPQVLATVWEMVWGGEVSNRRLLPLQALQADHANRRHSGVYRRRRRTFGHRHVDAPVGSVGEWYLLAGPRQGFAPPDVRDQAMAKQLLKRWGIVAPRCLAGEVVSGFKNLAVVFKELEKKEEVVQGAFVENLGASQFALTEAADMLSGTDIKDKVWMLAATDPANPYGSIIPWPKPLTSSKTPQRVAAARVFIRNGELIGYIGSRGHDLITFPVLDKASSQTADKDLVEFLTLTARPGQPMLLRSIDGQIPGRSHLVNTLRSAGFLASRQGYIYRV